jgi:hypothetical protein
MRITRLAGIQTQLSVEFLQQMLSEGIERKIIEPDNAQKLYDSAIEIAIPLAKEYKYEEAMAALEPALGKTLSSLMHLNITEALTAAVVKGLKTGEEAKEIGKQAETFANLPDPVDACNALEKLYLTLPREKNPFVELLKKMQPGGEDEDKDCDGNCDHCHTEAHAKA